MAIAALEAGKHVWCEKPMSPKLADAERMAAAARRSGRVAILGYNYIQSPAISYIKSLLDEERDRRRQSFAHRDGRGLSRRSRPAAFLAQRRVGRLWRARRFRRPSAEPDCDPVRPPDRAFSAKCRSPMPTGRTRAAAARSKPRISRPRCCACPAESPAPSTSTAAPGAARAACRCRFSARAA